MKLQKELYNGVIIFIGIGLYFMLMEILDLLIYITYAYLTFYLSFMITNAEDELQRREDLC
jgi:hypothetical protein